MPAITVYKNNHQGEMVWHYTGEELDRGATWICLQAVFDQMLSDLGFVVFRRGDVFTEWFFSDRWYNIFRVQDGHTGALKGWYCNVTRPARILRESVHADDLALDVFVQPNGNIVLLDEQEFAELDLSTHERMAALRAVETLRTAVAVRHAPFDEVVSDTDALR
jgi:uncharacterized protein